jgi:hypothetical protein
VRLPFTSRRYSLSYKNRSLGSGSYRDVRRRRLSPPRTGGLEDRRGPVRGGLRMSLTVSTDVGSTDESQPMSASSRLRGF